MFLYNFILFIHTDHAYFDFKWCSVFTEIVALRFEKGLKGQNYSSLVSHHQITNPSTSNIHHSSHLLALFGKPWHIPDVQIQPGFEPESSHPSLEKFMWAFTSLEWLVATGNMFFNWNTEGIISKVKWLFESNLRYCSYFKRLIGLGFQTFYHWTPADCFTPRYCWKCPK